MKICSKCKVNKHPNEFYKRNDRPCATYDLSKANEQSACFHYTNLQPLWAKDNLTKGDKI